MGAQIPQFQALSIVLSVFLLLHINSPDMHRGPLHLRRRSCWQAKWKSFLWLRWSSSRTRCRWPQALGPHGPSRELDQLKNRWDASLEMGSNWVNGWASGWAVWNFLQTGRKGPDLSNQDFWQNTWKLILFCSWPAGSILRGPVIQENDIWGWLEVRRSALLYYTVNQHQHWACWQYGHSGRTQGWQGVWKRVLWLLDTSSSSKHSWWAVVGFAGEWAQWNTTVKYKWE